MNPKLINALLVLAYLTLGMIGIAFLLSWALKRFGWPKQPSSKMPAPESQEQEWRKADSASIPSSDRETERQRKLQAHLPPSNHS
jgi:hypothetical protein